MIGGGSAGAVIANRLSEDCTKTVLLLEAGGNENTLSSIPLLAANLQVSQPPEKSVTIMNIMKGLMNIMLLINNILCFKGIVNGLEL